MVTAEFDKLVQHMQSPATIAKHLRDMGFPKFDQSVINYWYAAPGIYPNKKYFTALREIGRMYGIEISLTGLAAK